MKFTVAVLTTLSLVAGSMAHMRMTEPEQWKTGPDVLAPLSPDGSDFPCQNAQNEISPEVLNTPTATYTPGGKGTLRVVGGATHGGGSGQMVITYDLPPTKDSVWRVLHSWEGNHPIKSDGNLSGNPDQEHPGIEFPIPAGLPAGKATVAWNWFNRVGNREHYMKCATVEVTGDASSRGTGYDSLATAFRANSNSCIVPEGTNAIDFGESNADYVTIAPDTEPIPITCGGGGGGSPSTGGGEDNSGSEETPVTGGSEDNSGSEETPATPTSVATGPTGAPEQEEDDNSESGTGDEEELPVTKPTAPAVTPTPSPIARPNPDNSEESDDSASSGGACKEGTTVCSDGNTWSQCGSGVMQNMGLIPAGLQCQEGKLVVKRSVRFSAEHRRHRSRHV